MHPHKCFLKTIPTNRNKLWKALSIQISPDLGIYIWVLTEKMGMISFIEKKHFGEKPKNPSNA